MPSLTYDNMYQADTALRRAAEARRASDNSSSSIESAKAQGSRRSSLRKILDQLKPIEDPIVPSGIYTPVLAKGPLFTRNKSEEWKKLSRYEKNAAVAWYMHMG